MNPSDLASLCNEMESELDKARKPILSVAEYRRLIAVARSYLIAREAIEGVRYYLDFAPTKEEGSSKAYAVVSDALKEIDSILFSPKHD